MLGFRGRKTAYHTGSDRTISESREWETYFGESNWLESTLKGWKRGKPLREKGPGKMEVWKGFTF